MVSFTHRKFTTSCHPLQGAQSQIFYQHNLNMEMSSYSSISEWQTYDKETSTDHDSFHFYIKVHWERDSKVIGICKGFFQKPSPLLRNPPNSTGLIHRLHLV